MKKIQSLFAFLFLLFAFHSSYGQLGFCLGSKGLPIFEEDFGSGLGFTQMFFMV